MTPRRASSLPRWASSRPSVCRTASLVTSLGTWTDGHSDLKSGLNRLTGSTRPIVAQLASAVPITNHGGKSDKRRVSPDGVGE